MKFTISVFLSLIIAFSSVLLCDEYSEMREEMVEEQIVKRGITNKRVIDAFLKVKRHLFVDMKYRKDSYKDYSLAIGEGQVIDRPYIVAMMTYVIAPDYDKKVLEIGTGSGFHAAILAELVKNVYTIENLPQLSKKAENLLRSIGYGNIHFRIGDGALGWKENAPFDGIICTYSPDHIPPDLLEQLSPGGKMIIPVSYSSKVQEFILIEKKEDGSFKRTILIPVPFTPLIRGPDEQ